MMACLTVCLFGCSKQVRVLVGHFVPALDVMFFFLPCSMCKKEGEGGGGMFGVTS